MVLSLGYLADLRAASATSVPEAIDANAAAADAAIKEQARQLSSGPETGPEDRSDSVAPAWKPALLLVGVFGLIWFAVVATRPWRQRRAAQAAKAKADEMEKLEDPAFAEFMPVFFAGQQMAAAAPSQQVLGANVQPAGANQMSGDPSAPLSLSDRLTLSTTQIALLRMLFSQLGRTPDQAARSKALRDLLENVKRLKETCLVPEFRTAWVVTSALQGLVTQLSSKPENVTPRILRSCAKVLDVLVSVCAPGVDPNFANDPPVRILAVDDDAISRHAISVALKKVFHEPDIAADGQSALALAANHHYDVIFLDVEMPGMDGFDLCKKIHATAANCSTPVVFVTVHSDLGARAQSTLLGAHDLIPKPFLISELAVNALTLLLQARLGQSDPKLAPPENQKSKPSAPVTRGADPEEVVFRRIEPPLVRQSAATIEA